jgi:S1-C subfamily serine protease
VNAVTEQDLDLLEEYLDGELAPDEADRVRARLTGEPQLAAALEDIRSQRDIRAALWRENEPSEGEAQAFAARVVTAARKQDNWTRIGRYARFGSAAAACLLVGFFAGWLGRDKGSGVAIGQIGPTPVFEVVDGPVVSQPRQATLGVFISEIRYERPPHAPIPMLLVRQVLPGSTAASAGLREGDLLLSLDGTPVRDVVTLASALSSRPGPRVLRILRNNEVRELAIELQRQ